MIGPHEQQYFVVFFVFSVGLGFLREGSVSKGVRVFKYRFRFFEMFESVVVDSRKEGISSIHLAHNFSQTSLESQVRASSTNESDWENKKKRLK